MEESDLQTLSRLPAGKEGKMSWHPYPVKFDSLDGYAHYLCPNDGLIDKTFWLPKFGIHQCALCASMVTWVGLTKLPAPGKETK